MEFKIDDFDPNSVHDDILYFNAEYNAIALKMEDAYADIDNYHAGVVTANALEHKYLSVLKTEDAMDSIITGTVSFGEKVINRILDYISSLVIDAVKLTKKSWLKYVSGKSALVSVAKQLDTGGLPKDMLVKDTPLNVFHYHKTDLSVAECFKALVLDDDSVNKMLKLIYEYTKTMVIATPHDKVIDETPEDAHGTFNYDKVMTFRGTIKTNSMKLMEEPAFILRAHNLTIEDLINIPLFTETDGLTTVLSLDRTYGRVTREYTDLVMGEVPDDLTVDLNDLVKSISKADLKDIVKKDVKALETVENNISKYIKDAKSRKNVIGRHAAKTVMHNCNTMTNILHNVGMFRLRAITKLLILARDIEK